MSRPSVLKFPEPFTRRMIAERSMGVTRSVMLFRGPRLARGYAARFFARRWAMGKRRC